MFVNNDVNKVILRSFFMQAQFDLTTLNGLNGFSIIGVPGLVLNSELGISVASVGDINGDGFSDLVLGAPQINSNNGVSYVIFGMRKGFPANFNLTTLNGRNGFSILGIASGGQLGWSVATAGDINGDGLSDLVLGAPFTNSGNGIAYVIFGMRNGYPSIFNLATLNGTNGFSIPGMAANGDFITSGVATAGDINGDGLSDLVLGSPGAIRN